jgi:hypothetical protein
MESIEVTIGKSHPGEQHINFPYIATHFYHIATPSLYSHSSEIL